ncbi:hypothetical protein LAD74_00545 [Mycoplasma sp. U97]|uniref:MSC_0622 family F1-like ATPase gamma subunit n=1 Tax=Mycoplasma tauri TaxID=547987 RepID=UPI0019684847|nr:hypothetical protein [Mycoplasma tauri]MBZ4204110.1 hypothetical protein [Mycoplasma tauri]MBZ4212487.1 hypothetical protein [Mycoplasma tauri]MBZ4226518.1 hypothetical protein [Mycoplasma tauri]QSB07223.1 hypothetical protein JS510_01740 [Mycoplasma tauri]
MDFRKLEEKLNNFKKIETKTNTDKNILLIEMIKQNKLLNFYVNNSIYSQNILLAIKNEYQITNSLIDKNSSWSSSLFKKLTNWFINSRELWIYVTEEQKFSTDSYSRYEENILKSINKKTADFITIGKRANKFCLDNKLNIIKSYSENQKTDDLSWELTQIVKILFSQNNYEKLLFVINSNKNVNGNFTILPISNFNISNLIDNKEKQKNINIKKFKIYPNINDFINIKIDSFIENSIHSLLVESSFYKAKVGLVRMNKISNELEEEMKKINKKINRIKREIEIEEIVLLTSKNNRIIK